MNIFMNLYSLSTQNITFPSFPLETHVTTLLTYTSQQCRLCSALHRDNLHFTTVGDSFGRAWLVTLQQVTEKAKKNQTLLKQGLQMHIKVTPLNSFLHVGDL